MLPYHASPDMLYVVQHPLRMLFSTVSVFLFQSYPKASKRRQCICSVLAVAGSCRLGGGFIDEEVEARVRCPDKRLR